MRLYLIPVMGICFSVDGLLLMSANRLAGCRTDGGRCLLASALGAAYAGACMLPGLEFLGGGWIRLLSLGAMGMAAFGIRAVRRIAMFALLNVACGGLAVCLGSGEYSDLLFAAAAICILCLLCKGGWGGNAYIPVVLRYGGREERVVALRDTGNRLFDPVTGESVLVVGAEVAERLLKLTRRQLRDPVNTLIKAGIPGLRLIPYRAVGQGGGLLLALRLQDAQFNGKRKSILVAFAPEGLDEEQEFQALIGGAA